MCACVCFFEAACDLCVSAVLRGMILKTPVAHSVRIAIARHWILTRAKRSVVAIAKVQSSACLRGVASLRSRLYGTLLINACSALLSPGTYFLVAVP